MRKLALLLFAFISLNCYWLIGVVSRANFEITRYELCSEKQGAIKFRGGVTKRRGKFYLHFNMSLPFPLDNNVGLNCSFQTTVDGSRFVTVHTIHEKNLCKAANLYMGQYWSNIVVAVKLPPRTCPIPAGQYHTKGVQLDFDSLAFENFPFGTLRFIMDAVNSSNPSISYLCILQEVRNRL